MTRSKFILLGIGLILVIGAIFITGSYSKVTFELSPDINSIEIKDDKGKLITKLDKSDSSIVLPRGNLSVIPIGDKLSNQPIPIELGSLTETIQIDPDFSKQYLDSLALSATPDINGILSKKYPTVMKNLMVDKLQVFEKGSWSGGLLIDKQSSYGKDFYRFIAHKSDNTWSIVDKPSLILSKVNYPETPQYILDTINSTDPDDF